MSEQYLTIMQESLKKKINILDEILRISQRQSEILSASPVNYEEFDRCVDDKDVCIEQLNVLDEGFSSLYEKTGDELKNNSTKYADWIKECRKLITEVTEKSVQIQALEARNKQIIEETMRKERKGFQHGKRSVEVARSYYRNMNSTQVVPPKFMDQKK